MKETVKIPQAKITVLTPVFVGTGNTIEPICYICDQKEHRADRYSMNDLLTNVPADQLLNLDKLARLAGGSDSKRDFYSIFETDDVLNLKPMYSLAWNEDSSLQMYLMQTPGNRKAGPLAVYEQCKALSKPIIPGSTLKGAIECAFKYSLLVDNLDRVKKNLKNFCEWIIQKHIRSTPDFFYLHLIYGIDSDQANNMYGDFIRDLYGCLSVRDISFESMTLLSLHRYPYSEPARGRQGKIGQPMGFAEHISEGAISYGSYPFRIDQDRVSNLKLKYQSLLNQDSIARDIFERFTSFDYLLNAIADYSYYMVDTPLPDYLDLDGLQTVEQETNRQDSSKGRIVLRVGKNTTYFFKTVSKLFLNKCPDLFTEYFDPVFSAGKRPGKGKKHKPAEFPDTFTFAQSPYELWPTGFIRIEYADKN